MTLCAQYAEEIDHHPDRSNSWNKVSVSLSTHSVGALTKLDIQLAKAMGAFCLPSRRSLVSARHLHDLPHACS